MLTLITGTPGAGKSLHAVWDFARHVPGTHLTDDKGEKIPRVLYSNIKDLLVEHQHIEAADLNKWHEWAKPGDVILFDEVQEVWRPRGLGSKVPECIAKLETHRHMGVDLILVTQHPQLLDQNIRRLINQHVHMRRIAKGVAMRYEWDHCSNVGQIRNVIESGVWWYPKGAYKLYKSSQLHTKTTSKLPKIVWFGVAALCGLAYAAPMAYGRITGAFTGHKEIAAEAKSDPKVPQVKTFVNEHGQEVAIETKTETTTVAAAPPAALGATALAGAATSAPLSGCITVKTRCSCFDTTGNRVKVDADFCAENSATEVLVPKQVHPDPEPPSYAQSMQDADTLAYMRGLKQNDRMAPSISMHMKIVQ